VVTTFYADSSALVKRYAIETGSVWIQGLCDPTAGHVIALAHIGLVEIAAALAVKTKQGVLPSPVLDGLLRDLQRDGRDLYWLIDIDQEIIVRAIEMTRRHKLRGYDATHLACALFLHETLVHNGLPAPVLLSADQELLAAAKAEGWRSTIPVYTHRQTGSALPYGPTCPPSIPPVERGG
jgi:predicted nucleic acid-binding protein